MSDTATPSSSRNAKPILLPLSAYLLLLGATAVPLALLAYRIHVTGNSGHLSLWFDLFLAWIPVVAGALVGLLAGRRWKRRWLGRTWMALLGAVWLAFLPNAPYLLTEVIHLDELYGPSDRAAPDSLHFLVGAGPFVKPPVWLDLMLLLSVGACGLLLTLAAVRPVHRAVARRVGWVAAGCAVVATFFLCGFGVGLGRFDRFNSWDLFDNPRPILSRVKHHIVHPTHHPGATGTTLTFGALLSFGYFASVRLRP